MISTTPSISFKAQQISSYNILNSIATIICSKDLNCSKDRYTVSGLGSENNPTTIIFESFFRLLFPEFGALIMNANGACTCNLLDSDQSNSNLHSGCCPSSPELDLINAASLVGKISTVERLNRHAEILLTLGKLKAFEATLRLIKEVLVQIDIDSNTSVSIVRFFDDSMRIWISSSHPTHLLREEDGSFLVGLLFAMEFAKKLYCVHGVVDVDGIQTVNYEKTWSLRLKAFIKLLLRYLLFNISNQKLILRLFMIV